MFQLKWSQLIRLLPQQLSQNASIKPSLFIIIIWSINILLFSYFIFSGNILPPENFKKYEHRFVPPPPLPPTPPPSNQKIDSLGQRYIPRSEPHLWKLSYKLSHPQYESVRKEIKRRQELMRNQPVGVSPKTFPSPLVPWILLHAYACFFIQ